MALGKVEICGVNTSKLPVLKNEEKQALFKKIEQGDMQAREEYIRGNLRLVLSVIKRFSQSNENVDDLFQIGCIGMLKAIDRFDLEYNVAFSTYAVPLITGEIRRFLRDDGIIKISRSIKENQNKIIAETENFRETYHLEPTIEQLAEICSLSKEDVVTAIESLRNVESIYKEVDSSGDGNGVSILDKLVDKTNNENLVIDRVLIKQLLDTLEENERNIIILRYYKNKTQSDIAKEIGITQVQVSRLEKKILNKLKKQINF